MSYFSTVNTFLWVFETPLFCMIVVLLVWAMPIFSCGSPNPWKIIQNMWNKNPLDSSKGWFILWLERIPNMPRFNGQHSQCSSKKVEPLIEKSQMLHPSWFSARCTETIYNFWHYKYISEKLKIIWWQEDYCHEKGIWRYLKRGSFTNWWLITMQ